MAQCPTTIARNRAIRGLHARAAVHLSAPPDVESNMSLDSLGQSDGSDHLFTTWQPNTGIFFAQQSQPSTALRIAQARHFSRYSASQTGRGSLFVQGQHSTARTMQKDSPVQRAIPLPEAAAAPGSQKAKLELQIKQQTERAERAEEQFETAKLVEGRLNQQAQRLTERADRAEQELRDAKLMKAKDDRKYADLAQEYAGLGQKYDNLEQQAKKHKQDLTQVRDQLLQELTQVRNQLLRYANFEEVEGKYKQELNQLGDQLRSAVGRRQELETAITRLKAVITRQTQEWVANEPYRARYRRRVGQAIKSAALRLQSETDVRVASAARGYKARQNRRTTYAQLREEIHVKSNMTAASARQKLRSLMITLDRLIRDSPPGVAAQLTTVRADLDRQQEAVLNHQRASAHMLHHGRALVNYSRFGRALSPSRLVDELLIDLLIPFVMERPDVKSMMGTRLTEVFRLLVAAVTPLRKSVVLKNLAQEPDAVIEFENALRANQDSYQALNNAVIARKLDKVRVATYSNMEELRAMNRETAWRRAERIILQDLQGQETLEDRNRVREAMLTERRLMYRKVEAVLTRLSSKLRPRPTASRSPLRIFRTVRQASGKGPRRAARPAAAETSGSSSRSKNPIETKPGPAKHTGRLGRTPGSRRDRAIARGDSSNRRSGRQERLRRQERLGRRSGRTTTSSNAKAQVDGDSPGVTAFDGHHKQSDSQDSTDGTSTQHKYTPTGLLSTSTYIPATKRMYSTSSFSSHQSYDISNRNEQFLDMKSQDSEWESCSDSETPLGLNDTSTGCDSQGSDEGSQLSGVYCGSSESQSQTSAYVFSDNGSSSQESLTKAQDTGDDETSNSSHSTNAPALEFHIPENVLNAALSADPTSDEAAWSHELYRNSEGKHVRIRYHTTFAQAETAAAGLLNEAVLGFDLEWEEYSKPGTHEIKRCISLLQLANGSECHLFHIARWDGTTAEDLMPPSLQKLLTSSDTVKAGVNVAGDAGRLMRCFGFEMQGVFELSHMYRLVMYGADEPAKVNKVLIKLADQVQQVLLLPLPKGEVRTSRWSAKLDMAQCKYAASDAYAGFRLFHALDEQRRALKPMPPRPAFWELRLPIELADGTLSTSSKRPRKGAATSAEADQDESDDEFFDALETQDTSDEADSTEPAQSPLIASDEVLPAQQPALATLSKSDRPQSEELVRASDWSKSWIERRSIAQPNATSAPLTLAPLRAYHLWHVQEFDVEKTAALLRTPPLASNTVASYVLDAIVRGRLAYDADRLKGVVQGMPRSVQTRYRGLTTKLGM